MVKGGGQVTFTERLRLWGKATANLFTGRAGADNLFTGLFTGAYGLPPERGTKELLDAYNTMPWLRAVTNKVSRSVASTTWQLYVVRQSGKAIKSAKLQRADYTTRRKIYEGLKKEEVLEEIDQHPLLDLLDNASEYLTGFTARQLTQIYLDLVGEAFWLLERNGLGVPVAYWILPPDWVIGTPTPEHPSYKVSFIGWQGEIPASEIIWFKDPNPVNPYARGSGTGRALADELETDEYAAKHVKSWFFNRARPDVIISADGLSPADTARLEEDWVRKNQGFWRAYKPYFLSKKVDVQALSQTFENMQLVDLRKYERDTILQVFGVPPEIVGVIENSNRATIEAADYLFAKWVLVPRLEFLRNILQEKLVPQFDDRLVIDYESPVTEDREFILRAAQSAPWSLTIDEWRELQGLEPLPDDKGQVYMLPFNLYPSPSLGGSAEPAEELVSQEPAPPASQETGQPETEEPEKQQKIAKQFNEDDIKKLIKLVTEQVLIDRMKPIYAQVVEAFGQQAIDDIGIEGRFDLLDPRVIHFLDTEAAQYVKGINQTTRRRLQDTLIEGVKNGESIPKLMDRVSSVFTEAKTWRAEAIARTETVRASNFGGYEGMKQVGIEMKEWLATRDERVRDSHLETDGQIVPIDEPFILGSGAEAMYPGDSGEPEEDINCRCTVAPVFEGKSMYGTEELRTKAWIKYENTRIPWERRMSAAVKKAFQDQQNAVMEELKKLS